MEHHEYTAEATALLMSLIATPSVSRDEDRAATLLERKMDEYGLHPNARATMYGLSEPVSTAGGPHFCSTPT